MIQKFSVITIVTGIALSDGLALAMNRPCEGPMSGSNRLRRYER